MPNRILRDWTDSEKVNALSANAERFFVRLIMKADDYGCYYGNPQLLKSYLFPLLDVRTPDISRWIAECEKAGLLASYEHEGKRYIEVVNYGQRLKNSRRKFPAPSNASGEFRELPGTSGNFPPESETGIGDKNRETETETLTNTPAVIPDGERAADDGGDVGAVLTTCRTFRGYPKTPDEVIEIAAGAGAICTPEMAEAYLLSRQSVNWIKAGNRPVRNVPADVKGFCLTWQQNRRDDEKRAAGKPEIDRAGRAARKKRAAELEREAGKWTK